MNGGSLVIVGTGIHLGHLTQEAQSMLSMSEKVLYCVADPVTERFILSLKPDAESLYGFYGEGKYRGTTYDEMTGRIMECVRQGQSVCAAFYGHPGFFVSPSHKAIELARQEGYPARMLPAVSSLDCLFADLGIQGALGCQIFEATDFMLRKRRVDTGSHVVILQVSALGNVDFSFDGFDCRNLPSLISYLLETYPPSHEVTIYQAPQYAVCEYEKKVFNLSELRSVGAVSGIATMYIPPVESHPIHLDMLRAYGMEKFLEGLRLVPLNRSIANP